MRQYGRYGLAFEDQERSPLRRYLWALWVIPVAVLCVFLLRGCRSDGEGRGPVVEDPATAPRYDAPETPVRSVGDRFSGMFKKSTQEGAKSREADVVPSTRKNSDSSAVSPAPREALSKRDVDAQPPAVRKLLALAMKKEQEDDLLGARLVLRDLLSAPEAKGVRNYVERQLAEVNEKLLFSDRPAPEKKEHTIAPGNLISRLAKQYGTTDAYILKVNQIDDVSRLRLGRKIWVLDHPKFVLTVDKSRFSAVLTLNGFFYRRYSVGLSDEVESGSYTLRSAVKHPVYRRRGERTIPYGGEGNILGTRYLLLDPASADMGLHGTWDESTLGRACSAGKIRFSNREIEALALLLPRGAKVLVKDKE